jgi:SseB protein N-terminal domain
VGEGGITAHDIRGYCAGVRTIPDPGFAGDDGSADDAVRAGLDEVAHGAPLEVAVAALCGARVLVPVVAVSSEETGTEGKNTDMAAVLMTGRDGRQALLAFSCLDSLRAWHPQARPVPVTTRHAAQAALSEGADALVVDVAGPVQVPIEGAALRRLADGHRLVRLDDGFGWAQPSA